MIRKIKSLIRQKLLKKLIPTGFYYTREGVCTCCGQQVTFEARESWVRESMACSNCHCLARERILVDVINRYVPDWKKLTMHESSPGKDPYFKKYCPGYSASHFYPGKQPGEVVGGYTCQNLEALTFADESFDLFVTQEVMEHLYDPAKAFREVERTIKKGGMYIFTTPLDNRHAPSQVWAVLDENGQNKWLHTPEYHGNPIDAENGSICTMHWGYDIVDYVHSNTGMKCFIVSFDDEKKGIRGAGLEVVVCIKNQ